MTIRDSEHEPESVKLKHLAGQRQNVAFFDRKKLIPLLGFQLGFKHKIGRYDDSVTLAVGDDQPFNICYDHDRDRIWIVLRTSPVRVLRMNPEDFTYDRLILPVGINIGWRIAYGYNYIWVTTSDTPASVIRIDPDTLAYTVLTLPNDGLHGLACGLCIGGGYVWVGCGTAGAPWGNWVLRMNPQTMAYTEVDLMATVGNFSQTYELVYDGQYIWVAGTNQNVCRITVDTLAVVNAGPIVGFTSGIWSGCWDGSYLWWGDEAGHVCKQNPLTYAYDVMTLELATGIINRMTFDGKYVHLVEWDHGYYYIIHPETMEYVIHEFVPAGAVLTAICFDGLHIWVCDGWATPGVVYRLLPHEPSRRVEHGQTATFAIDALANISIAVTFDLPFTRTPIVVVSLNDVTNQAASIVNVEAQNVTVNGFNARCRVAAVGAGGSTARFMWIATERSTHHP